MASSVPYQIRCLPWRGSLSRNANGMVASVSADTIITVAGMPTKSLMKPANGGATAAAPMAMV